MRHAIEGMTYTQAANPLSLRQFLNSRSTRLHAERKKSTVSEEDGLVTKSNGMVVAYMPPTGPSGPGFTTIGILFQKKTRIVSWPNAKRKGPDRRPLLTRSANSLRCKSSQETLHQSNDPCRGSFQSRSSSLLTLRKGYDSKPCNDAGNAFGSRKAKADEKQRLLPSMCCFIACFYMSSI